jgi:hypothetical protein
MKSASTGALSGCLVWVLTFFLLSTCLCPLSVAVGTITSFASGDFVARLVSPYLCPPGSTGQIRAFETTTTDDNGNSVPATGYEMICVDASGAEVANTGPVYAFVWVGVVTVLGLVLTGVLAIFLAVPAGALFARWMSRRSPPAAAVGPV